ncbi:hypothetical protein [Streptomyces sp. 8N706]|uniref:hypothetical protein n=1 Tax=Streptomyces sp. 8N706 TaxID=3457416 RepID=UPI003FCFFE57
MADYAFPGDLVTAQQELHHVRAELSALLAKLPWSVTPEAGFRDTKEDGYWHTRERPDSPGWSQEEQAQVAALRKRQLALAEAVVTHDFWTTLSGPDRVAARSAIKHLPDDAATAQPAGT